jgi:RHS repeat-associated protein
LQELRTLTEGYTGREWDAEANLYYYRARWYDPQVGKFISEDPIGLKGGINLYGYVENNPLGFRDPMGLDKEIADLKIDQLEYRPIVVVKPAPQYEYNWWGAFFEAFDFFSNLNMSIWRPKKKSHFVPKSNGYSHFMPEPTRP